MSLLGDGSCLIFLNIKFIIKINIRVDSIKNHPRTQE